MYIFIHPQKADEGDAGFTTKSPSPEDACTHSFMIYPKKEKENNGTTTMKRNASNETDIQSILSLSLLGFLSHHSRPANQS